jgi:hypothetical protein
MMELDSDKVGGNRVLIELTMINGNVSLSCARKQGSLDGG